MNSLRIGSALLLMDGVTWPGLYKWLIFQINADDTYIHD